MACDLSLTQTAACESGIGKLDNQIALLQLIAQLSCEIADAGGTPATTPDLPLNSVQFNEAGAFGGSNDLTWRNFAAIDLNIIGRANAAQIGITGYSLTAANAQSMLNLSGTWNTTGNPIGIRLAITDTASGATAKFLEFLGGAGGATSLFSVDKLGQTTTPLVTIPANANANAIAVTGYSLTAANAQHMLDLAGTWNTTGNPTGIRLSIVNTASGGSSFLMNLLAGAAGATSRFSVNPSGVVDVDNSIVVNATANEVSVGFYRNGVSLSSTGMFTFGTGAAASGTDVAFARNAAGIVEVNSGVAGTFRDLWARHLRLATAFTVATLPAAGVQGRMAYVTDALTPTFLTVAVGGGAVIAPVFDNGSSWVTV